MNLRENLITSYFNSWITKNASVLENTFAANAVYIESWGPAYRSLIDITRWFDDWNMENTVLQWTITRFLHQGNTCICEWYFECECSGNVDGFNGASIIDFDNDEKIIMLKEFQSKTPNQYPYE